MQGCRKFLTDHIAEVPIYSETITNNASKLRLHQVKCILFPEQCFNAAHQFLTQFLYVVTLFFRGKRCIEHICPWRCKSIPTVLSSVPETTTPTLPIEVAIWRQDPGLSQLQKQPLISLFPIDIFFSSSTKPVIFVTWSFTQRA